MSAAPALAAPVMVPPLIETPLASVVPETIWMSNKPSGEKLIVAASAPTSAALPLTLIDPPCCTRGATIAT